MNIFQARDFLTEIDKKLASSTAAELSLQPPQPPQQQSAAPTSVAHFGRDTTIIERRRKIKDETIRKRRLVHQRQAA
jgi:hypothetical protein